jgi:hypothetical protein
MPPSLVVPLLIAKERVDPLNSKEWRTIVLSAIGGKL